MKNFFKCNVLRCVKVNKLPYYGELAMRFAAIVWTLVWVAVLLAIVVPAGWGEGGLHEFLAKEQKELIEFIGLGIAGGLAVIGAIAVNSRARAQANFAAAQVKNNELVEKGHIQERFKTAMEHLGHSAMSVRIAAFYAFRNLAVDNPDMQDSIFEILCAHARQTTTASDYRGIVKENARTGHKQLCPTEEVRSLLGILLSDTSAVFGNQFPQFDRVNLTGLELPFINLHNANLVGANLEEAMLYEVDLSNSLCMGVNFTSAELDSANFYKADVRGVLFNNACLHKANFRGADVDNADFSGADLHEANFSTAENLDGAKFDNDTLIKGTIFPDNFVLKLSPSN